MDLPETIKESNKKPSDMPVVFAEAVGSLFSKKLVNVLFLIICSLLVIGVLLNFWLNNQFDLIEQPVLEQQKNFVEEKDTLKWNIYTDYDYGFSFSYPNTWEFKKVEDTLGTEHTLISFFNPKEASSGGVKNHVDVKVYDLDEGLAIMKEDYISQTNIYTIREDYIYRFEMLFEAEEELTQELRQVYLDVFKEMLISFKSFDKAEFAKECRPTGCSSQICSDEDVVTSCVYSEAFSCYKEAVCERQGTGECGWTMSDTLRACLKDAAGISVIPKETIVQ